ncbi:MAG: hypothetical protein BWX80_02921 [Candidatus Hydrogenedentes bacterium ADurb.Bin101]|nr:MAG: hypothetical protein BWX80_02921 [Candidatus Hydrogenedentes bacterium ADurb.Bin101]
MKTGLILPLLAVCSVLLPQSLAFAEDSPPPTPNFVKDGKLDIDAAIQYFDDLYRSESSTGEVEMTVTRPRRTQTMRDGGREEIAGGHPIAPARTGHGNLEGGQQPLELHAPHQAHGAHPPVHDAGVLDGQRFHQ